LDRCGRRGGTRQSSAPDGGVALRGWLYPSPVPRAPFVLVFRGDNETIAVAYSQARDECFYTALDFNVVGDDYRATGFSDGTISLAAACSDAFAIFDDVAKRAQWRKLLPSSIGGTLLRGTIGANE